MFYLPPLIREWFLPAPWTTCCLCSNLMGANKASEGEIPATIDELNKVWTKAGKGKSGYNSEEAANALQALFGHHGITSKSGWQTLVNHVKMAGRGVVIYGRYPKLPTVVKNNSKQSGYTGLHAIYVQLIPSTSDVNVGDPLAKSGYTRTSLSSLKNYAADPETDFEHTVYVEGSWSTVLKLDDAIYGSRAVLPKGVEVCDSPGNHWWTLGSDATVWPVGSLAVSGVKWIVWYVVNDKKWAYAKNSDVSEWLESPAAESRLSTLKRIRHIAALEIQK